MDGNSFIGTSRRRLSRDEQLEILNRVAAGEDFENIAVLMQCSAMTVRRLVNGVTPVMPAWVFESGARLTLADREEIAHGLQAGESIRSIAIRLGRAPSTISREIQRGRGLGGYRAWVAVKRAVKRAKRPKERKLMSSPKLFSEVNKLLERRWSPEQISVSLQHAYPDDEAMRVSAEAIYQTLYLQARGELRKEVSRWLRSGRAARRPRGRFSKRGKIRDMILISERPAEVEDRAVPGHWEGDLLFGANNGSAIATLVERKSKFIMLVSLPEGKKAEHVNSALVEKIKVLPEELKRSLTWDRGKEMAEHKSFTVATGVQVYFCDPQSPWQRGSNENANGLLRQYLPRSTNLNALTQDDLNNIAEELNTRPRKTLDWTTPAEVLAASVATTT